MNCKHPDKNCENQVGFGGDNIFCNKSDDFACPHDIPSPLTIEINEGLFCGGVKKFSDIILFGRARKNGRLAWIRVRSNGLILGALQFLNARQINEIIRVRAALNWTGREYHEYPEWVGRI